MGKNKSFFLTITLLLVLFGCSQIMQNRTNLIPKKVDIIEHLSVDFPIEKALYDPITRTIYAKNGNEIQIFKNGKKINVVGRSGFGQNQFNQLSDIALSPAGDLLALDSFRKKIYRYDQEGSFIAQIDLSIFANPVLLQMTNDEKIYIYDSATNEIYIYENFSNEEPLGFGKFTFSKPQQIGKFKDTLFIYDIKMNKTFLFNSFGQELEEISGNIFIDQYEKFQVEEFYIKHLRTGEKYQISAFPIDNCFVRNGNIIVIRNKELDVIKIQYDKEN